MDTRKSSFRLLSLLTCAAAILLLAAACEGGGHKENSSEKEEFHTMMRANTYTLPECTSNNTRERRDEVLSKYLGLIMRQPNWHGHGAGNFKDENGERLDIEGITVIVYPMVDQNTLPPEDRIPDCLEGIPVQIFEEENEAEIGGELDELREELRAESEGN